MKGLKFGIQETVFPEEDEDHIVVDGLTHCSLGRFFHERTEESGSKIFPYPEPYWFGSA